MYAFVKEKGMFVATERTEASIYLYYTYINVCENEYKQILKLTMGSILWSNVPVNRNQKEKFIPG